MCVFGGMKGRGRADRTGENWWPPSDCFGFALTSPSAFSPTGLLLPPIPNEDPIPPAIVLFLGLCQSPFVSSLFPYSVSSASSARGSPGRVSIPWLRRRACICYPVSRLTVPVARRASRTAGQTARAGLVHTLNLNDSERCKLTIL